MKWIVWAIAISLIAFAGALVANALLLKSRQVEVSATAVAVDTDAVADRLSQALQFPTIATEAGGVVDRAAFDRLHEWIRETYPRVHQHLEREQDDLSLLYTWPGTDSSKAPVLFLAHEDVVPALAEPESDWTHNPFAGAVDDGFVWGRGALDMKSTLVGLLEASEHLLASGYQPSRTLMFAFGQDEEVGGPANQRIAAKLKDRGLRFEWILDEGLTVTDGIIAGAPAPVALIGIAEKGMINVVLEAEEPAGHASMPPAVTSIGRLAEALVRVENNPFPAQLDGVTLQMLEHLAPEMPFMRRVVLGNLWLFDPVVRRMFTSKPPTNAQLRSTVAPTMIAGSQRMNVLAKSARAVLNVRVHPRDSLDSAVTYIKQVVADGDSDVKVTTGPVRWSPSAVSSVHGPGYRAVESAIRATFPDAIVTPGLLMAGTDSRHYAALTDNIYRFMPARMTSEDVERVHGIDERIPVANVGEYVQFYAEVLQRAGTGN